MSGMFITKTRKLNLIWVSSRVKPGANRIRLVLRGSVHRMAPIGQYLSFVYFTNFA